MMAGGLRMWARMLAIPLRSAIARMRPAPGSSELLTLDKLLAGVTEENWHAEVDLGPPVGNNIV